MENYIHCDAKGTVMMGRKLGKMAIVAENLRPPACSILKQTIFLWAAKQQSIVIFGSESGTFFRVADGDVGANETACEKNQNRKILVWQYYPMN